MANEIGDVDIIQTFQDELGRLRVEENKIDELYDEVKAHWDIVVGPRGKGGDFRYGFSNLPFVERQTANLATLKAAKVGAITSQVALKRTVIDLMIKKGRIGEQPGATESPEALLLRTIRDSRLPGSNLSDDDLETAVVERLIASSEVDEAMCCDSEGVVYTVSRDGTVSEPLPDVRATIRNKPGYGMVGVTDDCQRVIPCVEIVEEVSADG